MRRALFLYNPIAGRRRERRLRDVTAAAEVFRAAGVETIMEATRGPGTTPEQARAAAETGFDTIIVCGGDGSIHEAIQPLVNTSVSVGVLPLGTGNGLANDLGFPRDPALAAEMLLQAQPRPLRLPRMDFQHPIARISDTSRYCLIGAGIGPDAQLAYRMTLAFKQRWGMTAYYAEAWRQWLTYTFPMFEIEFLDNGRIRRERVTQVLAIRIEWFGGFLRRLAPGASLMRDDLRLVLVKSRRRWPYVRYVTGLQFGKAWIGNDIELVSTTEFTCRALENSRRIFAEADGELLSTLPVTVKMTNDTVNLLVPKKMGLRQ